MTLDIDQPSLTHAREFFDDAMYAMVDFRLSFEAPPGPSGFPEFAPLRTVVTRLNAAHRTIFRLFRLGEAVDAATVAQCVPRDVLDALLRSDLLHERDGGTWQTPGLLLIPIEGVLVFASVPPSYPTVSQASNVCFDLSSFVVARALPGSLAGRVTLDICCGSGVQSILCARRGADHVIGLDISDRAIRIAQCNAVFNGVGERTQFRLSDGLSALGLEERFDFVVCNTPHAPMVDDPDQHLSLGAIGNSVLLGMLADLPRHFSDDARGILGAWRSIGLDGRTHQKERVAARLADSGYATSAFVDPAPDTVESVLRLLQTDVEQRFGAARSAGIIDQATQLFRNSAADMDGFYNQVLAFRKTDTEADAKPATGIAAPARSDVFGLARPGAGPGRQ